MLCNSGWRKKIRNMSDDELKDQICKTFYNIGTLEDNERRKKGLFVRKSSQKSKRKKWHIVLPDDVPPKYRDDWNNFYNHDNYTKIQYFYKHFRCSDIQSKAREMLKKSNLKNGWFMTKLEMNRVLKQLQTLIKKNRDTDDIKLLRDKLKRIQKIWRNDIFLLY